jgi:hypothetical protein
VMARDGTSALLCSAEGQQHLTVFRPSVHQFRNFRCPDKASELSDFCTHQKPKSGCPASPNTSTQRQLAVAAVCGKLLYSPIQFRTSHVSRATVIVRVLHNLSSTSICWSLLLANIIANVPFQPTSHFLDQVSSDFELI